MIVRALQTSVLLFFLGGVFLAHCYFRPIGLDHEQAIKFSVASGESIRTVSSRLKDRGYIIWQTGFILLAKFNKLDRSIKAGTFHLRSHFTAIDILETLTKSPKGPEIKITIPEGFNRWQLADLLASKGWNRRLLLRMIEDEQLEGRLFPDTYQLGTEMTESQILAKMQSRFEIIWERLNSSRASAPPLSKNETVILASLVEKETVDPKEAPLIARVFLNRLKQNMKLQSDPTYIYTEDRYAKKPTKSDRLAAGNPYNTDMIIGLPPGAISNPGKNALMAALNPAQEQQSKKLLYFVAKRDGSGQHHFSETYTQHKKAIKRFLK